MISELMEGGQLLFSVVIAAVLLKFLLNDMTHKMDKIIELLQELRDK